MGWGFSTRRGGDRKVRSLPRKFVFHGLRRRESGMSCEICWDVPDPLRVFKKFLQKKFVLIFRPIFGGRQSEEHCDFCNGMVASPLAAAVATVIFAANFPCEKSNKNHRRASAGAQGGSYLPKDCRSFGRTDIQSQKFQSGPRNRAKSTTPRRRHLRPGRSSQTNFPDHFIAYLNSAQK